MITDLDRAEVGEEEMSRHRLRQYPASDSNVMSPKPTMVIVVRVRYTLVAHEQLTMRDMTQRRWRNLTGDGASPTRLDRSGTVMPCQSRRGRFFRQR